MTFWFCHCIFRGNRSKEEELHPPRIHLRELVHKPQRLGVRESNTMSAHTQPLLGRCGHTHAATCQCTPTATKKSFESRREQVWRHKSQVLIKQRRCGTVNETPSYFVGFCYPAARMRKCVPAYVCLCAQAHAWKYIFSSV